MKLNDWAIVSAPFSNAPELYSQKLRGDVTDHPELTGFITTSSLVGKRSVDLGLGEETWGVVTKSGSVYLLGDVLPDYEQRFPDARNRLINSLPVL